MQSCTEVVSAYEYIFISCSQSFQSCFCPQTVKMTQMNDFYVCLTSDGSLSMYENTKSYFTNQFIKPFKLKGDWVVGLTEIFLSPILQNEVEKSNPRSKRSERLPRFSQKELIIFPFGESNLIKIVFNESNFKSFQYAPNHMNFGKFLDVLPLYINPISDLIKKKIKMEMFVIIDSYDVKEHKQNQEYSGKSDVLHIYSGSRTSTNTNIPYETFYSLKDFMYRIISSLPANIVAKKKSLYMLFDLFYPEMSLMYPRNIENMKTKDVEIDIKELGANISVPYQSVLNALKIEGDDGEKTKILSLNDFFNVVSQNAIIKVDGAPVTSIVDKVKFLSTLKNRMIDSLRGYYDDKRMVEKKLSDDDFVVNVNNYGSKEKAWSKPFPVILEMKKYKNIGEFLNDMYKQLPADVRSPDLFSRILVEHFNDNETKLVFNSPPSSLPEKPIVIPTPPLSLPKIPPTFHNNNNFQQSVLQMPETKTNENIQVLAFIYSDIVVPRLIGDTRSRFLRIIPIIDNATCTHMRFDHIEYIPISRAYVDDLTIIIGDVQSRQIKFEESGIASYIVLHFKQRK